MTEGQADRARREEHEALAHHFPALAALTPEEFDWFVEAALARAGPQRASDFFGRSIARLGVFMAATVWFIAVDLALLGSKLPGLSARVPAAMIAGLGAVAVLWIGRGVLARAQARSERRARVLAVKGALLHGPRCAGCGYSLEGVTRGEGALSVAKCPECGLVNPVIAPATDRSL